MTVAHRGGTGLDLPGVASIRLDRNIPGALASAIGPGFDVVIDTVAYDDVHARQLLDIQADIGAFVVVSSASVYSDARGRSLDEAETNGFPRLPLPIPEGHITVTAGPATYSTRKVALEQTLLAGAKRPMIILRPCAIHGPGSPNPREWFFVKRILDGRSIVPLAFNGESRFHTTATVNIAALIEAALSSPRTGVLNIGDPEALSVRAIGETIAAIYGADLRVEPFDGAPIDGVGSHPWCVPRPFVVDMTAALALGYQPAADYRDAIESACRAAEAAAAAGASFAPFFDGLFDYAAEDAFLAGRDHALRK